MASRYHIDKNKSQIVFDYTGGEKTMKTMTMETLPKAKQIIRTENQNYSLRTDDIAGAQPRKPPEKTREDFYYTDDIEGTHTHNSFDKSKPPVDILRVDDIAGARPKIQRSLPHSERHTNPLHPDYELPTKPEEPYPVPRFIRDNINYDDVEGVHSKSYKTNKPPRDIMKTDDINGTSPKHRIRNYNGDRNLDVSDINKDGVFKTRRETNPLHPDYFFDGRVLETDFGIQHSRYLNRRDNLDLSLKTSDISGAQADSSTAEIRGFRMPPPPSEDDIDQPSTVLMLPSMTKQGIELERQRAIDQMRGEKIRRFENRQLHAGTSSGDAAQERLMHKRPVMGRRPNVTFQISDSDL